MAINDPETESLLRQAGKGDAVALGRLLEKHRTRLKQMVAVRLDRRVASRLDSSDVVQDALIDASTSLDDYLREPLLPFYPWLRRIVLERVIQLHRHHLYADKRSMFREQSKDISLGESTVQLADFLASSQSTPSQQVIRGEVCQQVRQLLERLAAHDREILVLRYLEDLTFPEIAAATGLNEGAVKMRHLRALERIRALPSTTGERPNR